MKNHILLIIIAIMLIVLFSCVLVYKFICIEKYIIRQSNIEFGVASWYAKGVHMSGVQYKGQLYNCASNYFPRYSLLLVENIVNKKNVIVWNNDTHEATDIKIDLSKKAFNKISNTSIGKTIVKITYLGIMKNPNPEIFGKIQKWN